MRLAEFILQDMEAILENWEAFAATQLPAARHLDRRALRDHAQEILQAVARESRALRPGLRRCSNRPGRRPS
jgi:hypothetical protein